MLEGENRPSLEEVRALQRTRVEAILADSTVVGYQRIREITRAAGTGGLFDQKSVRRTQSILELVANGQATDPNQLLNARIMDAIFGSLPDVWQNDIKSGSMVVLVDISGNQMPRPR